MLPELMMEALSFLSGQDLVDATDAIASQLQSVSFWPTMLVRDYPGINHDMYGDDPAEQYRNITFINDSMADYGGIDDPGVMAAYEEVGLSIDEYIYYELMLRNMMYDTNGEVDDVTDFLNRLDPREVDILQVIYDALYDVYMDEVHRLHVGRGAPYFIPARRLAGGTDASIINYMIAHGQEAYDGSGDGLAPVSYRESGGYSPIGDVADAFRFEDLITSGSSNDSSSRASERDHHTAQWRSGRIHM